MTAEEQLEAAQAWILAELHKGEALRLLEVLLGLNRAGVIEGASEVEINVCHRALGRLRLTKKIEQSRKDNAWRLVGGR